MTDLTRPPVLRRVWEFPVTRFVVYVLAFALLAAALSGAQAGVEHLLRRQGWRVSPYLDSLAGEGIVAGSAVAAFWAMARFADRRPWATAGFGGRGWARELLGGFGLGAALISAGVAALALSGAYHVAGTERSLLLLAPLPLYFGVAVFEEIFFRGYLFQTLETRWGSGVALAATCLLFGLAHLANHVPGTTLGERLAGPVGICFEAGLPLAAAYLLTRRWWLPVGIHWAWDYFEGPVYGCPDSGTHDPHTFLHAHLTGPFWLTGGPFGPEAGLAFLAVGTLLGVVLLRLAVLRGQWKPHKPAPA